MISACLIAGLTLGGFLLPDPKPSLLDPWITKASLDLLDAGMDALEMYATFEDVDKQIQSLADDLMADRTPIFVPQDSQVEELEEKIEAFRRKIDRLEIPSRVSLPNALPVWTDWTSRRLALHAATMDYVLRTNSHQDSSSIYLDLDSHVKEAKFRQNAVRQMMRALEKLPDFLSEFPLAKERFTQLWLELDTNIMPKMGNLIGVIEVRMRAAKEYTDAQKIAAANLKANLGGLLNAEKADLSRVFEENRAAIAEVQALESQLNELVKTLETNKASLQQATQELATTRNTLARVNQQLREQDNLLSQKNASLRVSEAALATEENLKYCPGGYLWAQCKNPVYHKEPWEQRKRNLRETIAQLNQQIPQIAAERSRLKDEATRLGNREASLTAKINRLTPLVRQQEAECIQRWQVLIQKAKAIYLDAKVNNAERFLSECQGDLLELR